MNSTESTNLPEQVAGVEVEAELGPVFERLQGHLGRVDVEGDLGRMDLQAELDAALLEDVEDRVPAVGQVLEPGLDHRVGDGWERVEQVPDRRAGEAVDDLDAELVRRRAVSIISLAARWRTPSGLPSPQTWSGRISLCRSSIRSQTAWPTRWFEIAQTFSPYLLQQLVTSLAVVLVAERLLDVEVVAPAGQLDALVTPFAGLLADDLEGQVGPLAGEKCHGT